MEITCERCRTRYAADAAPGAGAAPRTPCPRCKHVPGAAAPGALMSTTEKLSCQSCGKPLADAFDEAIGTCAACRAREERQQGPLEIAGTPTPARAAAILAAAAEAEANAPPPGPPSSTRTPLPTTQRTPLPIAPLPEQPALSAERRRSPAVLVVLVGLLLGAAAAGGYLLYEREQERRRLAALPPPIPPAVTEAVEAWRQVHGPSPGNPVDLLLVARKQFARDTPAGYAAAELAYQQAAVVDPNNDAALLGYVQAVALGRDTAIDDATYARAERLAEAMLERTGGSAAAQLATANLLLTRPSQKNVERARALAQRAVELGQDRQKAEALVVVGRCFAATSAALAIQSYEEALKLAPDLLQAVYHRALARAASGELSAAIADLEARLAKDPQHPRALSTLARLFQEVGEVGAARKVLERALAQRADPELSLELAIHSYQLGGRTAEAIASLRSLVKTAGIEPRLGARAHTHLAAAERAAGNREAAARAAAEALRIAPDHAPAHFQAALAALARKDAAAAQVALAGLRGRTGDPALEGVLEGRIHLLDGRPQDALPAFTAAAQADPRRLDASLLAGAVLARSGRRADAIAQVFVAVNGDPARAAPRPLPTEYFVQDGELLRGFEGDLQRLAENADDPMPLVIEGVYRYFLGDHQDADVLFQRAIHLDAASAVSYGYRALIALGQKQQAAATELGGRAAFHGKQIAIARYAHGAALVAAGADPEVARAELREAQGVAASWLSIELRLAELDRRIGNASEARARLQRAVAIDPTYLEAKRLLFELERQR